MRRISAFASNAQRLLWGRAESEEQELTIANPVIAEILRGERIESFHRGSFVVVDAAGMKILAQGDITSPVYPRSAIKAFQCVPVIESGAADHFGLTDEEIALCCSSHNGEASHVRVAASILAKAGIGEAAYECGSHWPTDTKSAHALVRVGLEPSAIHNNCSGKHAGMLALAKHLGVTAEGYVKPEHPVQRAVAAAINQLCEVDVDKAAVAIDGCSVPTWALPLSSLAKGFAGLSNPEFAAGRRIIAAARAHPLMIEGSSGFDSKIMQAVPRLFVKFGAEGVFCGTIPHARLGFALKCDDGAGRAARLAVAGMLLKLDVWTAEEKQRLESFATTSMHNWRKLEVGQTRASF